MDKQELLKDKDPNEIFVCPDCGSTDIEEKCWTDANTGEIVKHKLISLMNTFRPQ